jgi:hypothetical protein
VRTIVYHFTDQIGPEEPAVQVEYEHSTMFVLIRSGTSEHDMERELSVTITGEVRESWAFVGGKQVERRAS